MESNYFNFEIARFSWSDDVPLPNNLPDETLIITYPSGRLFKFTDKKWVEFGLSLSGSIVYSTASAGLQQLIDEAGLKKLDDKVLLYDLMELFPLIDQNERVTNAKLAKMPAYTFKANNGSAPEAPKDLTVDQARDLLGISNLDNTSDLNKPISKAVQAQLTLLHNLISAISHPNAVSDFSLNTANGELKLVIQDSTEFIVNVAPLVNGKIPSEFLTGVCGFTTEQCQAIAELVRVPASYILPTIELNSNVFGVYEVGDEISNTIEVTFTQNDAGAVSKIELFENDILVADNTGLDSLTYTLNINDNSSDDVLVYKAVVTYLEGPLKQDSNGDDDGYNNTSSGIPAGTLELTDNIEFMYKAFYGKDDIVDDATARLLDNKFVQEDDIILDIDASNETIVSIAYPKSFGDITRVQYVGALSRVLNPETEMTKSEITIVNNGNVTLYNVYKYIAALPFNEGDIINIIL